MSVSPENLPLDTSPLAGLWYRCRPDCGLCCYAEPLVSRQERREIVRRVPAAEFAARGKYEFLRSRPDGGACQLLEHHRCRAHAVRPAPCREYPLGAYAGSRLQAIVALTCPGVDLTFLDGYDGPGSLSPAQGLDEELAALRARLSESPQRHLDESRRRRRRVARVLGEQGRWVEEDEVRRQLRGRESLPTQDDLPATEPPRREDGLELLPLVFDGREGPLAFAAHPEGCELLQIRPAGGIEMSLGVAPPSGELPPLSDEARRLLTGYQRYWLERDPLFGVVHLAMVDSSDGDVVERVAAELRRIAAAALSRARILASLAHGRVGVLSGGDMIQGIRATDQDLLDRPSSGTRL